MLRTIDPRIILCLLVLISFASLGHAQTVSRSGPYEASLQSEANVCDEELRLNIKYADGERWIVLAEELNDLVASIRIATNFECGKEPTAIIGHLRTNKGGGQTFRTDAANDWRLPYRTAQKRPEAPSYALASFENPTYQRDANAAAKCRAISDWFKDVYGVNFAAHVKQKKYYGPDAGVDLEDLARMFEAKSFGPVFGTTYQRLSGSDGIEIGSFVVGNCGLLHSQIRNAWDYIRAALHPNGAKNPTSKRLVAIVDNQLVKYANQQSSGAVLRPIVASTGVEVSDFVGSQSCPPDFCNGVKVTQIDPTGPLYIQGVRTGDIIVEVKRISPPISAASAAVMRTTGRGSFRGERAVEPIVVRVTDTAKWASAFTSVEDGEPVQIKFFNQGGGRFSRLWIRRLISEITYNPNRTLGQFEIVPRTYSVEETLERQRHHFAAKYRDRESYGFSEYNIGPYSDAELRFWDPSSAQGRRSNCTATGSYPSIPELTFPDNFRTSYPTSVQQIDIAAPEDFAGAAGNAFSSVANARAILERVVLNLETARNKFWKAYDAGRMDETLKHEYAYWLYIGRQYNTGSARGALEVFFDFAGSTTAGKLSYPIAPAQERDAHQYFEHSDCSPKRSNYAPEREAANSWYYYVRRGGETDMSRYVDFSITAPPQTGELDTISGVIYCARAARSRGESANACISASPLTIRRVDPDTIAFDRQYAGLLDAKKSLDSLWSSMFGDEPNTCSKQQAYQLIDYMYYRQPQPFDSDQYVRAAHGWAMVQELCRRNGELPHPLSDALDEYRTRVRGPLNLSFEDW